MPIHWIVTLSGGYSYASYEQPGLNSEFQTPELIPDQSTRKKFLGSGIWITVHLGYPLLTVFCSVALESGPETRHDTLAASIAFFGRGSQWGGRFYGYRLKFWLFYGYRLIFFSYG